MVFLIGVWCASVLFTSTVGNYEAASFVPVCFRSRSQKFGKSFVHFAMYVTVPSL